MRRKPFGLFGVDSSEVFRELKHYGRSVLDGAPGPGSGRYPRGSGEDPNQHRGDIESRVKELKKQGMREKEIAQALGYSSTGTFRTAYSLAVNERKSILTTKIRAMLDDGMTKAEVSRETGLNESTIRSMLNERTIARANAAKDAADFLRSQIDEKGMIDVGAGVEVELGISREKMAQALKMLQEEGYEVYKGSVEQATNPGQQTIIKVVCPPGTPHRDIYNFENIHTITDYKARIDEDGNEIFEKGFEFPASMDSSRLMIRYRDDVAPDGHTGVEKDGMIEIRRGVQDLDLGESHYAQVRILVDNDKYLKGMAVYSDDVPDGVDVVFNTNKTPGQDVLKGIKDDPENPFGSALRETGGQYHYTDANGERKLGLINKTRQEGDWNDWDDVLPSQFLSKQPMQLINKQLNTAIADKQAEFDDIMSINNPTVKKQLLTSFADDCDSTAVHLEAAALPRQKYQVILPVSSMKDNEVYAPNYQDGETVALVRFPHAGTFEIPVLTVNNKQPDGQKLLGKTPADAVGISSKVAARLSGADFDGDTVMVIPCNSATSNVKIKSTKALDELVDFDPKMEYGYSRKEVDPKNPSKVHYYRDGHEYNILSEEAKQKQMGVVSNLITDMTIRGADVPDLVKAVRHSMVVIDAEKHKLDWKQSEIDNDIATLKKKYQTRIEDGEEKVGGASTLLSRAKSETRVPKTKGSPKIDPNTGELVYKLAQEEWTDKSGKVHVRTQKSTQMADTKDARTLSSGTAQEEAYATYANKLKAMANQARKETLTAGRIKYSSTAKETYADEVENLKSQLMIAQKNAPRERQAQLAARSEINAKKKANPDMTTKEEKKISQQALNKYRLVYGAKRSAISISPRQWEAIQAGAISENVLSQILRFADGDQVRAYATPKSNLGVSPAKQARIRALKNSGYTTSQIADALNLSSSTVSKYLAGK